MIYTKLKSDLKKSILTSMEACYKKDVPKTFTDLRRSNDIDAIQDPVYETPIPTEEFIETYQQVLVLFDGSDMCSHINFFFQRDPTNHTLLEFVDEDARLDFLDEAQGLDILPPLQEIYTGESKKEKIRRGDNCVQHVKPKIQLSQDEKQLKIQEQKKKTLLILRQKLEKCTCQKEIERLQKKMGKISI